MRQINVAYLLLGLVLTSCSKDEVSSAYGIVGAWQLYEQGSSPGFGYNVESVPSRPVQSLTFTSRGELFKQGDRLSGFFDVPYYRVDSSKAGLRLLLLKNRQDTAGFSLGLRIDGQLMRISPPCYEGCHYGLKRID